MAIANAGNIETGSLISIGAGTVEQTGLMVEDALRDCERRAGYRSRTEAVAALKAEAPAAQDYFRHSLASQLARFLAAVDRNVVTVHSFCYGDAEEEASLGRGRGRAEPLNLILHVRQRTAALGSVIASVDSGLLAHYRLLIGPGGERMTSLLNAQVVDDEEVSRGTGVSVVLRSLYSPPQQLWPE